MEEELTNLLKVNLEEAWRISDNLDNACQKVAEDFFNDLKDVYEKRGFNCTHNINLAANFTSFNIWKDGWKNISISIMVHSVGKNMVYGFLLKNSVENKFPEKLINQLRLLPNNTESGSVNWPWHRTLERPYGNWYELEAWQTILNGKMKEVVVEKIDGLLSLTKEIDFSVD